MGRVLIVSRQECLSEQEKIAAEYDTGFEINDFFDPEILDDERRRDNIIKAYLDQGIPAGSTLHGAFFDVVVFSRDEKIRRISCERMRQSMEVAVKLGVRGVVFHTNINPMLASSSYDSQAVSMTVDVLRELLMAYPTLDIYLENMFDGTPDFLVEVSKRLTDFEHYGVCFDYAHAMIYGKEIDAWVRHLAPFVKHLHINDNDGKSDLHLALGRGQIDWAQFGIYYREYFQGCSVLIETNEPEAQRASLQFLKSVAVFVTGCESSESQ